MASRWDFIKNFGKKEPPKQEAPPPVEAVPLKKGNKAPPPKAQDIELAEASEAGVFEKLKTKLNTGLLNRKPTEPEKVAPPITDYDQTSMDCSENLPYIIVLIAAGCFFLIVAYVYFGIIYTLPHKFTLALGAGGLCFLACIGLSKDPIKYFKLRFKGVKLIWTLLYIISVIGTFVSVHIYHYDTVTLGFAIAQIVTLAWMVAISIPGVGLVFHTLINLIKKCFTYCEDAVNRSD